MDSRRAGRRLRNLARERQRDLIHEHWRKLLLAVLVWVGATAVAATVGSLFWPAEVVYLWVGGSIGAFTVMWMVAFQLLDPVGRRYISGADGERWTAEELRKLRRHGWRTVHNIYLEHRDIDHVAIGPGGVVAIETKSSDGDWEFLVRCGKPATWVPQARRSARTAAALVKQHAHLDMEARAVLAVWAAGVPGHMAGEMSTISETRVIHGSELGRYLLEMDPVLSPDEVKQIHGALDAVTRRYDEVQGISRPGRLRSLTG
jgi:hypothetical protein